mgnify:CR=1 FL=1
MDATANSRNTLPLQSHYADIYENVKSGEHVVADEVDHHKMESVHKYSTITKRLLWKITTGGRLHYANPDHHSRVKQLNKSA